MLPFRQPLPSSVAPSISDLSRVTNMLWIRPQAPKSGADSWDTTRTLDQRFKEYAPPVNTTTAVSTLALEWPRYTAWTRNRYGLGSLYSVNCLVDPSPKVQIKSGIKPESISCKENLELIFKSTTGVPACVKPETATKLIQRGWVTR